MYFCRFFLFSCIWCTRTLISLHVFRCFYRFWGKDYRRIYFNILKEKIIEELFCEDILMKSLEEKWEAFIQYFIEHLCNFAARDKTLMYFSLQLASQDKTLICFHFHNWNISLSIFLTWIPDKSFNVLLSYGCNLTCFYTFFNGPRALKWVF